MVAFRGFELAVLTVFPGSGFRYCCPRRKFPITMNATAQPDTRSFTTPQLCTGDKRRNPPPRSELSCMIGRLKRECDDVAALALIGLIGFGW